VLDRFVEAIVAGRSQSLVMLGEPGIGKSALLRYLEARSSECRLAFVTGVQSEMELAFAGLHQLLVPMLDEIEQLPSPQCEALRTALGIGSGSTPDRFLVSLAVLSLLSNVAEEQPLVCLIDDEQWLDRVSVQVLAFVARRLDAESVGLVFACRTRSEELVGLAGLNVEALRENDARALLNSVLAGPLDSRVRDRIVCEARGNPLGLLELPRSVTPAELAGGFGLPRTAQPAARMEAAFERRIGALPPETLRLLQIAAAEPVGDPTLLWRAAKLMGIGDQAATSAVEDGLIEIGTRVLFRHPLVRSVAYRSASPQARRDVHRVLGEATDAQMDPDRRAWHRAQAANNHDEETASELELSADRALERGGLAAAAAFMERAATLTPEATCRARRLLAAARAKREAGSLDAALGLLVKVEAGPLDPLQAAETQHLRGQITFDQRRPSDASRLLLAAAKRLESLDVNSAREAHLEALGAALWSSGVDTPGDVLEVAQAAQDAPCGLDPPRVMDVLLDAFALRLTKGYSASAPSFARAIELFLASDINNDEAGRWLCLTAGRAGGIAALELWDAESWRVLVTRQVQFARATGALVHLQLALNLLAWTHVVAGELPLAALLFEEDRMIADATGNAPVAHNEMLFAAWKGEVDSATELIEATVRTTAAGGLGVVSAAYASSVLYNGLGRHEAARDTASRAFGTDPVGYGPLLLPEIAEAASKVGDVALVKTALDWISERTRVTPSEWALGIEARVRALLSEGDAAEGHYRQSILRLGRTSIRPQLARSHLLYGEWLLNERRRSEAREELRIAYDMLDKMEIGAFAQRARRQLVAIGGSTGARRVTAGNGLTAKESQIAVLAREGLSNPEIGARLFISPRTVQYHLHKVFTKLGIGSRNELDRVLSNGSIEHALREE
jgi:DNA-binding CsgD family transcriptional regulator